MTLRKLSVVVILLVLSFSSVFAQNLTTSQLNSFGKRMQEKTSQFNIQTIAMTHRYAVYIYGGGNVLSNGYDWENLPQDLADVKTP